MIRVPIRVIWMVALQAVVAFGGQVLAAGGAGEPKTSPTASPESASPPGDFVRGAMAAESRGDRVERERLVEQALVIAPDYAPARWLAGQVRSQDEWLAIDNVLEKNAQDGALAEYQKLRAVYAKSPEGELTLARWCQKHHLMDEMRAHASRLLTVRQNDPELLKMLDLVWHKGQLIATAELAERRERDEQTKQAMQHWRPIISAIRTKIESNSTGEREEGIQQLAEIRDPAAIDAMLAVLKNRPSSLCEALRVIGKMPGQEATDALLQQAVISKSDEVIKIACRQLKGRSPYGYVPKLMAALATPARATLEVDGNADGMHFRRTVVSERENGVYAKTLDTEVGYLIPNVFLANIIGEVYAQTFLDTLMNAKALAKQNQKLKNYNDAIYRVLDGTVGSVAPHTPAAWWEWWQNYNVMSSSKKPVYVDRYYNPIDVPYLPWERAFEIAGYLDTARHDGCFARGTKVWTASGQMPIENVQIGDRVLSVSALTGELSFKPVLDVTVGHQPFVEITTTDKHTLAPTPGHAFWISGIGWRLARDLKVGDRLHATSGWTEIESLKQIAADETHNLVVADFNTYFVGDDRVLVHDITIPQVVTGGVPGELAAH